MADSTALRLLASKKMPYQTPLTAEEEKEYRRWAKLNKISDIAQDYDARGFWKAAKNGLGPDGMPTTEPLLVPHGDGTMHGPDTWKVPGYGTFSNESKYHMGRDPFWTGTGKLQSPGAIQNSFADPFNEVSYGSSGVSTIADESKAQQNLGLQALLRMLQAKRLK